MLDLATSLNGLTEKVTTWEDTLEAKDLLVNMIKAKVFCNNSKKTSAGKVGNSHLAFVTLMKDQIPACCKCKYWIHKDCTII